MYRLVDALYERVKGSWEERFERSYGFWRGFVDEVVLAFQACGDFEGGFARVYCDACRSDYLVAFSCSRRVFCPSCAAKRAAIFGALLREEILEEVGHAQWVFTIPKLLRPYFLHHRELLGKLSRAAWETVHELIAAANADDRGIRPGMVSVVQTATDLLEWSPHVHALVSRGGWDRAGIWVPVPYVDATSAELLFRHKVIALLRDEELLSEQRIELLLSWQNTGFSVHDSVTVEPEDAAGSERLARYLLRPPLSLERMSLDAEGSVLYRCKAPGRFGDSQATFDAMDCLARLLMHIPAPKLHTVRYYGEYSSVARARRRVEVDGVAAASSARASGRADSLSTPERRRLRRAWAQMIRRIYEVDPLTCRCGAQMRILSFILDPRVITKILEHIAQHIAEKGTARERAPPSSALAPSGLRQSSGLLRVRS